MADTRVFAYRLPDGEVRHETRREDQEDPLYAILASNEGGWGLYRMTQNDEEIVRCVKELLPQGQSACITRPWPADDEDIG